MSMVFSVQHPWHYRNWEAVLKHFEPGETAVHVSPWRAHLPNDPAVHARAERETLGWLAARGVDAIHGSRTCSPRTRSSPAWSGSGGPSRSVCSTR
mgnify:CR=1 FL=1